MSEQTVVCPHCSRPFALTEALSSRIKEEVRKDFEAKARQKELEIKRREDELSKRAKDIENSKKALEAEYSRKLELERARISEEAKKRAEEKVLIEIKDLKEENEEKARQLDEARRAELEVRKKARELEEERKKLELETARRLDEEREKIRQSALEMFSEEHRLRDLEKDKRISDMGKMIEELKRKAEQGSMQTQGEVLELDLEAALKMKFPTDAIEPVPKGMRGADIIQKVYTRGGQFCGTIVWESKRTKAWSQEWIEKLKDDQREIKAEVAVIVSEVLPKGVTTFAQVEGLWVTGVPLAIGVAEALRVGLIQVAQARLSAVGKNEKMEAVYNYLSGAEFRQKIEAIVEAFKSMKDDLENEKRAMMKLWAKREKQIERVVTNTVRMYGEMQGIITTLPEIKSLELAPGDEATEEDKETLF